MKMTTCSMLLSEPQALGAASTFSSTFAGAASVSTPASAPAAAPTRTRSRRVSPLPRAVPLDDTQGQPITSMPSRQDAIFNDWRVQLGAVSDNFGFLTVI